MDNPDLVYLINNFVGYEKLIEKGQENMERMVKLIIQCGEDFMKAPALHKQMAFECMITAMETVIRTHGPRFYKAVCLAELQRRNLNFDYRTQNILFCCDMMSAMKRCNRLRI